MMLWNMLRHTETCWIQIHTNTLTKKYTDIQTYIHMYVHTYTHTHIYICGKIKVSGGSTDTVCANMHIYTHAYIRVHLFVLQGRQVSGGGTGTDASRWAECRSPSCCAETQRSQSCHQGWCWRAGSDGHWESSKVGVVGEGGEKGRWWGENTRKWHKVCGAGKNRTP